LENAVKRHIEFLGLPGSGKTASAGRLYGFLKSRGYKAFHLEEALYCAIRRRSHYYTVRYPVKYCSYERGKRWMYKLYRQPQFSYDPLNRFLSGNEIMVETLRRVAKGSNDDGRTLLIKWLVRLFSNYQLIRENLKKDEMLIIDEGFCSRALSIFGYDYDRMDPAYIQTYVEHVPAPDIVICVSASLETRQRRLAARGVPLRLKKLSMLQRKTVYRGFEHCLAGVLAGLEARKIPIIHIDNEGTLEDLSRYADTVSAQVFSEQDNSAQ
jgi:thymidylate kinase